MRILAVSHAYPRKGNTSHGVFIHRLHLGLRELGAHVEVLQLAQWSPRRPVSEWFGPWREARLHRETLLDDVDGVRVHHPVVVTPRPSRFAREDPWTRESKALVRFCTRNPDVASVDVVLGHFMVPDGFHAVRLGRALDVPVAAMAWGDDVHAWPEKSEDVRRRLIDVLEHVDLRIACSRRLAKDATVWLHNVGDNWRVIYAGVDLEAFSPERDRAAARAILQAQVRTGLPADAPVLLMAGQPVPEKGYLELLKTWNEVAPATPSWHLVMMGGTGSLDVPSLIDELGLATRAHWIGLQPAERMPDLMRGADAFVLPSHNEGLSLSVLESLATGLPTIATDVGGHSEVIRSDDDGWLIPARDAAALRAAVLQLTTNAAERERRAAGSRRAAERIGSPRDNAAKLLTVLRDVVARKSGMATVGT